MSSADIDADASSAWAPLRHAVFRRLWLASSAGYIALWMQNVAAAWTMTSLTSSPLMVALIQTAATLPAFLFGLPGGVLADLLDRRLMLLASNLWLLVAASILCALIFSGHIGPWTLLALTFAAGAGYTLQAPAWQATNSDVLPRSLVPASLSLNGISANASRAVGPAIAGGLIAAVGAGAVYGLNAFCYAAVVAVLLTWRNPPRRSSDLPSESLLGGIQAGLRYVRHSHALVIQLARCLVVYFSASALWALLPVAAKTQLNLGASGYGMLLACLGGGAVIGAMLLAKLQARYGPNALMQAANLVFALVTLCLAYVPLPFVVYVAL